MQLSLSRNILLRHASISLCLFRNSLPLITEKPRAIKALARARENDLSGIEGSCLFASLL